MKKISIFWLIALLLLFRQCAMAQADSLAFISPRHLQASYDKTTNIIFPYAIKSADRGSRAILVQKARGADNILQLKAARKGFVETNLSVITDDNRLYSFIVDYCNNPERLNWQFFSRRKVRATETHLNAASFRQDARRVLKAPKRFHLKRNKYGIAIKLEGIYAKADAILIKLDLRNRSGIRYDIGSLQFAIRDKRQAKRSAIQEELLEPLYRYKQSSYIAADSSLRVVYALPKFSLSNKQYMAVRLAEKNGNRDLELKLNERALSRAQKL